MREEPCNYLKECSELGLLGSAKIGEGKLSGKLHSRKGKSTENLNAAYFQIKNESQMVAVHNSICGF